MTSYGKESMHKITARRPRRWVSAASVASAAILWGTVGGGATAVAFDHPWANVACTGVPAGGTGLWDDAPGAGANNESAFFWVRNTAAGDEQCTWGSSIAGIPSTSFPNLQVRAATNDGARFTVRVFNNAGAVIATATVGGAGAHSGFVFPAAAIPPGHVIRKVWITLDDDPDAAAGSSRSSALIDYIRIYNAASGATGWIENFTRAG
jgi:hypothetical protein